MRNRYGFGCSRVFAVALIVAGVIILLSSIPCWMWLAAVGLIMILIGVIMLKQEW